MNIKTALLSLMILSIFGCKTNSQTDDFINSVEEAIAHIKSYEGDVKDFKLQLKNELTLDNQTVPTSIGMALITDAMIKKGWTFNGQEEVEGGEIYYYKIMEESQE